MAKKRQETRKLTEATPAAELPKLRLEYLDPAELESNPANWRDHPQRQLNAIEDVISEVGWAGALLYNERTKRLIDGHARKEKFQGKKVPVLIGSWTEEEEKKILATLDPIGAMGEANQAALAELLPTISTQSDAVNALLIELSGEQSYHTAEKKTEAPDMERLPFEQYDYVLVLCKNTIDFLALCERLGLESVDFSSKPGVQKIGLGRCVPAERLLKLMVEAKK
jgi:hypothetical protein